MIPKIKISENPEKITNPGFKKIFRFFDKETDHLLGDVIALRDEELPTGDEYEIFDPNHIWKKKQITNFYVKELQEQKRRIEADAIMDAYLKSGKSFDEIMTFLNP